MGCGDAEGAVDPGNHPFSLPHRTSQGSLGTAHTQKEKGQAGRAVALVPP